MSWVDDILTDIYDDFEENVVGIKRRRDLMMAYDLCYHSVLAFNFNKRLIQKGIVETLCIGDTRSGKSHTAEKLHQHYRVGDFIHGEGVTMAGLLGGIDEGDSGGRFVRCGRIPLNHHGMINLDEANEIPTEILAKFSGFRSSGVFDLIKIIQQRIPCRVRIIWIANSRSDRDIDGYSHGVEVIPEVMGKKEDIARFDVAILISRRDIDEESLYSVRKEEPKPPRWTSDVCHEIVMWAWTRTPEQVIWAPGAERAVMEVARELSRSYSDGIPLVIQTEQPTKVARCAVSCACRTFSADGDNVVVSREHVEAVGAFFDRVYQHPSMDYSGWSAKTEMGELEKVFQALGSAGLEQLLHSSRVTQRKFEAIFRDKEAGVAVWSELMLLGAIIEDQRGRWSLSPAMIQGMKRAISDETLPRRPDRMRGLTIGGVNQDYDGEL